MLNSVAFGTYDSFEIVAENDVNPTKAIPVEDDSTVVESLAVSQFDDDGIGKAINMLIDNFANLTIHRQQQIITVEIEPNDNQKTTLLFSAEMWSNLNVILSKKIARIMRAAGDRLGEMNSLMPLFSSNWFRGEIPIDRTSLIWNFTENSGDIDSSHDFSIDDTVSAFDSSHDFSSESGFLADCSADLTYFQPLLDRKINTPYFQHARLLNSSESEDKNNTDVSMKSIEYISSNDVSMKSIE